MSDPTDDEIIQAFAHHGVRAITPDQWTAQTALDTLRENRRRYAGSPATAMYEFFARRMIETLPAVCNTDASTMSGVLIAASGMLGMFSLANPLTGADVAQILGFVADELDRQANGGEQP